MTVDGPVTRCSEGLGMMKWAAHLLRHCRVLGVGSGTGIASRLMAARGAQVLGVAEDGWSIGQDGGSCMAVPLVSDVVTHRLGHSGGQSSIVCRGADEYAL